MPTYEYKVVAAPKKGLRHKGVKGTADRFAHTLMGLMNTLGRDGWEYQRADTLPVEERSGLTGTSTTFQHMLVFRRVIDTSAENFDVSVFEHQPAAAQDAAAPISLTPTAPRSEAPSRRLSAVPDVEGQVPDLGPALSPPRG